MLKNRKNWPIRVDKYTKIDVLAGLAITTIAMFSIFIVSLLMGVIEVREVSFDAKNFVYYTGLIFLSAGYEELVFRCIILTILIKIFKKPWIALLITSIYFGYVHLDNDHATLLSAFSNGLGGIMYGLAFIYTRKIWFPWALHFAWNYVQAPILGFPVSGFEVKGILQLNLLDHTWISGGLYGPEGGIIGILSRFLVIALIILWYKRSRKDEEYYTLNLNHISKNSIS
jgi:uncharacterized protein